VKTVYLESFRQSSLRGKRSFQPCAVGGGAGRPHGQHRHAGGPLSRCAVCVGEPGLAVNQVLHA